MARLQACSDPLFHCSANLFHLTSVHIQISGKSVDMLPDIFILTVSFLKKKTSEWWALFSFDKPLKVQLFKWFSQSAIFYYLCEGCSKEWQPLCHLIHLHQFVWENLLIRNWSIHFIYLILFLCLFLLISAGYWLGADREACLWAGVYQSILSRPPLLFPDRKSVRGW